MSALYNLEPQPTAKVLLTTTSGDLLLELFAKQTPLASRSFLQHCLNGYYNGTIFHRLVPGFILQGGDPTGTGHGGESAFPGGKDFEDEFHSRLKFNRRGLLGMANDGKDRNGSQFFLTLGETRELQDKHTLFGRVEGDTIYNLMKMGEAELEGDGERPVYPTKITGAEILVNPFEDMVKSEVRARAQVLGAKDGAKKKGKKKAGKALLSFGSQDVEDDVEEPLLKKETFNPKLVHVDGDTKATKMDDGASKYYDKASERAVEKTSEKFLRRRSSRSISPPQKIKPNRELQLPLPKDEEPSRSPSSSPEPEQVSKVSSLLDKTNAQIAEMKASMKRNISSVPAQERRKKSALEQMIPENSMRGRKRKHNSDVPVDKQSLDILAAFKAKLESAPPEIKPATEPAVEDPSKRNVANGHDKDPTNGDDDDEANLCDLHFIANCQSCQSWDEHIGEDADREDNINDGWMSHALSFEKDRLGKDLSYKKKAEEELVVIDPREKERSIREEQRAKKLAKMGGSSAWDRDRNQGRAPERRAGERA
ncbi:peptidyl-prolyl cis-trans isomerase SDCCAG10, partial [Lecanoromycetidae sp. Uapishka_2]